MGLENMFPFASPKREHLAPTEAYRNAAISKLTNTLRQYEPTSMLTVTLRMNGDTVSSLRKPQIQIANQMDSAQYKQSKFAELNVDFDSFVITAG